MPAEADKKNNTKKRAIKVVAIAAALVVAGGAAFAWWTAGGSGNGNASTGNVTGITINQTSSIGGLYPGGPAGPLAGNFTNSNSGPVYVSQVSVAVLPGWSVQANVAKPPCTGADFTLVQPGVTNAEVPSGPNVSGWTGGSIALVNAASNQDNCKAVSVPLVYTSN